MSGEGKVGEPEIYLFIPVLVYSLVCGDGCSACIALEAWICCPLILSRMDESGKGKVLRFLKSWQGMGDSVSLVSAQVDAAVHKEVANELARHVPSGVVVGLLVDRSREVEQANVTSMNAVRLANERAQEVQEKEAQLKVP